MGRGNADSLASSMKRFFFLLLGHAILMLSVKHVQFLLVFWQFLFVSCVLQVRLPFGLQFLSFLCSFICSRLLSFKKFLNVEIACHESLSTSKYWKHHQSLTTWRYITLFFEQLLNSHFTRNLIPLLFFHITLVRTCEYRKITASKNHSLVIVSVYTCSCLINYNFKICLNYRRKFFY